MANIRLERLSEEEAYVLDFESASKSSLDWKQIYASKCIRENLNFIAQGSFSDFEYYKKIKIARIYYRLFDGDKQIGEAIVAKENDGIFCIEWLEIKEEFRGMGFGRDLCWRVVQDVFDDSKVSEVYGYDESAFGQSKKIFTKLGFVHDVFGYGEFYLTRDMFLDINKKVRN